VPLTARDKLLYARHLLLPQVGHAGQERLCAAELHVAEGADPRAAEVCAEYLARAGCRVAGPSRRDAARFARQLEASSRRASRADTSDPPAPTRNPPRGEDPSPLPPGAREARARGSLRSRVRVATTEEVEGLAGSQALRECAAAVAGAFAAVEAIKAVLEVGQEARQEGRLDGELTLS